ncbi:MAG: LamG domain-containing protein [Planctomycetes bacterium]|nr:LamG domain-containing protein [Planctomycetota bacterium]
MKRITIFTGMVLASSLFCQVMQAQTTRPASGPSPDEAVAAYNSLFGEDAKKASASRNPKDWQDFANKLLDAVKLAKDSPVLQGVFCDKAYDFAIKDRSGAELAITAMKTLMDVLPDRKAEARTKILKALEMLYQTAPAAEKSKAGETLLAEYVSLIDDRMSDGKSADAIDLCRKAQPLAAAIRSDRAAELTAKLNLAVAIDKVDKDIAQLEASVKADPKNAANVKQLVILYVVNRNDPARAVGLIDSAGDEAIRIYVPLAVKPAADLAETACAELAEWYKSLSEKADSLGKPQTLARAAEYYRRFLELHTAQDVQSLKAKMSLETVEKELAKCVAPPISKTVLPRGAVLAFNFDRANITLKDGKTYVKDLSGRENHGEIVDAKMVESRKGQAVDFSESCRVEVRGSESLNSMKELTVCLWLKPTEDYTEFGKWKNLVVKRDQFSLLITGGKAFGFRLGKREKTFDSPPKELKKDTWYFLAVTYDGKKAIIYVNGAKDCEAQLDFAIPGISSSLVLGGSKTADWVRNTFVLDDVMIFERVLSESEIAGLAKK